MPSCYRLLALALFSAATSALAQPNVVLILADEMTWDGTSALMDPNRPDFNSDYHSPPAPERLAREGKRFTDAYAPHPNCSPTRLAIQTGKLPLQLKMSDIINRNSGPFYEGLPLTPPRQIDRIPHEETTIAERLKLHRPDYKTAHFGKWQLGGVAPGKRGCDERSVLTPNRENTSRAPDPKRTVRETTRSLDFLRHSKAAREPFFRQGSYHAVYLGIRAFDETLEEFEARPWRQRYKHPGHVAMTYEHNQGVGHLLEALDRQDLAGGTQVIVMSGNGSYLDSGLNRVSSNAPLPGQKASAREGGVRVPPLVHGPGIEAGSVSRVPVSGTGLYSAIEGMARVQAELPQAAEGASLLGLLRDRGKGAVDHRFDSLVWHFPHYQTQKGLIRVGDWKLAKSSETGDTQLFDLDKGIGESSDLSAAEPKIAKRPEKQMASYLEGVEAPMARRRE